MAVSVVNKLAFGNRSRGVAIATALALVAIVLSPSAALAQEDLEDQDFELPEEVQEVFGDDATIEQIEGIAATEDGSDGFVGWFEDNPDPSDSAAKPAGAADTGYVAIEDGSEEQGPPDSTAVIDQISVVPSDIDELTEFVASDGGGLLIVTLRTDIDGVSSEEAVDAIVADLPAAAAAGVTEADNFPIMFVPPSAEALEALLNNGMVANVEADRLAEPTLVQVTDVVNSDNVNAGGAGGTGVGVDGLPTYAVAVIDTGVDLDHGAFNGRIVSQACYAQGSDGLQNGNGDCPNGGDSQLGAGAGNSCGFSSGCLHGTHVAGIAVGNEPAGAPAAADDGVAPGAELVAINAFSNFAGSALSFTSDQIRGLDRVAALVNAGTEVRSVNMSLGGGQFFDAASCDAANVSRKAAIDTLRTLGVATVIAAGNNGWTDSMSAPGCISTAISVGATTDTDGFASFTNSDFGLDYWAPGVSVFGPVIGNNAWGTLSGTSMSTPVVAGTYALLAQCSRNGSTIAATEAWLDSTGPNLTRSGVTARRINVLAAARQGNPNDLFASAEGTNLAIGQSVDNLDTNRCGTATDGAEPGEATAWFRINPAATGTLTVQTLSNFDTQLSVYTAPTPGAVSQFNDLDPILAFDDDSGNGLNGQITIPVNGFKDYWVQVDGFDSAQGDFTLRMALAAPPTCLGQPATAIHDYPAASGPWSYTNGDDVVFGSPARDIINLSGGDDIACLFDGNDIVDGEGGADTLIGGEGADRLDGGTGVRSDVLSGGPGNDILSGNDGDDILTGNDGNDEILGGNGLDRFTGGPGDDFMVGGAGNDVMNGNGGNDIMWGQDGNDFLSGNAGEDELLGGNGQDDLRGGANEDLLVGGDGDDDLFGQTGSDTINGNNGNDSMFGLSGNDIMNGGAGNDLIRGNAGNDVITGGSGNDDIVAARGNDSINGGSGNGDVCNFGIGTDTHVGGCETISNLP